MERTDILIIGAGLAGLSAAQALSRAGHRCVLLEKSRGLGGRAATRRIDDIPVDHGAQFFTARSQEFQQQVAEWLAAGICHEWSRGFHFFSEGRLQPPAKTDSHPRYACSSGMTALAKHLAQDQDIRRSCLATEVCKTRGGFEVASQDGQYFHSSRLILTAPLPQALTLTDSLLGEDEKAELQATLMTPCFAIVAETQGPTPEWKGIQVREGDLSWIGADFTKRVGHPSLRFIVLQATGDYTRQQFETPLPEVAESLLTEARRIDPINLSNLEFRSGHRWRYAKTASPRQGKSYLSRSGLLFAGDAFGGTIESAWLSGRSAVSVAF